MADNDHDLEAQATDTRRSEQRPVTEHEPPAEFSTLAEVMSAHPQLTFFGIGVFSPERKTRDQRATELAAGRERLASREAHVNEVAAWLRHHVAPIKTPTQGSYGLKHLAEDRLGGYVSNGELIAAALMVGYPHSYVTPNVLFGMSKRDLDQLGQ